MEAQGKSKVLARVVGPIPAILTDNGWDAHEMVVSILNKFASPDLYGPSDGDPIIRAANDAAKFLGGKPEILVKSPYKLGTIY